MSGIKKYMQQQVLTFFLKDCHRIISHNLSPKYATTVNLQKQFSNILSREYPTEKLHLPLSLYQEHTEEQFSKHNSNYG